MNHAGASAPARSGRKPVIGIVGGIGSGKSLVAEAFRELGAAVIDSDRLAHAELNSSEVQAELRKWWGDGVFNDSGLVDRRAVGRIVFRDPAELKRLERLLYPRIELVRKRTMASLEDDPAVRAFVLDAPKLYEAGLDRSCDAVVFVDADRGVRLIRLRESRGWSSAELQRRENLQDPLDSKRARADYVVSNNSSPGELRRQVIRVFELILGQ